MPGRLIRTATALCVWLWLFATTSTALAGPPEDLVQPTLKGEVQIEYPADLLELEEPPAGTVTVKYTVGIDGVPKDLSLVTGVHPRLDALALEAVSRLRFDPGTYQGKPVEIILSTAVTLAPPEPAEPTPPEEIPDGEADPSLDAEIDAAQDPPAGEEGSLRIRGRLREAAQRTPVTRARVLAVPAPPGVRVGKIRRRIYEAETEPEWSEQAISDDDGQFELRGLPDGPVRLVVLAEGYERLEYVEMVDPAGILELEYFVKPLSTNPYRTVVDVEGAEEDTARRTITTTEINAIPGTQGDALKSLQNFPGVARTPFGAGALVVRGASPSDSVVILGYHEIPQLFHFGALTSVFNSDALAQIDFIPGNFDSRYGDAIGGVINVAPRKGKRDGFHGYVDSDLFDTGVLIEGPVGKGSYLLSGRRSYIDAILPAVIPDDANLDFNTAPRYWDYQALLDYPMLGGDLSVRVFGSDDRLALVAPSANDGDADSDDAFETSLGFHRADLVYRAKDGPWSFLLTPSYRYDFFTGSGFDVFEFETFVHTFSGRAEISRRLSKRSALRVGTELVAGQFTVQAQSPSIPQDGLGDRGDVVQGDIENDFARPALYATATLGTGKWTFFPGVRLTYNALVIQQLVVDPRLRARVDLNDAFALKMGAGMFSQAPDFFELVDVYGNPDIGVERGAHLSFGGAQNWADLGLTFEVTGFYKYIWNLARFSEEVLRDGDTLRPEVFANTGSGHIAGAEVLLRKDLTKSLFGWVSYTYSRSLDRPSPSEPLRPFDFDQPHILTLIGVYKLPHNWQFGARFRLVSGNPDTPITDAIYETKDDEYIPIEGDPNSDRLPAFHQLDLRVDRTFVWNRSKLNLYLDVQNVYNARNIEAWNYAYNYQQRTRFAGLPIIPSLGLRVQW